MSIVKNSSVLDDVRIGTVDNGLCSLGEKKEVFNA